MESLFARLSSFDKIERIGFGRMKAPPLATMTSIPSKTIVKNWKTQVLDGEPMILTIHQNGVPDAAELTGPRYKIIFRGNSFHGFLDFADNRIYSTPSQLCCAKFTRVGATNQWRGPMHCLVFRNGSWVPLGSL